MVTLFVTSDIHSHFDIFIKELEEKGYDKDNPNHWLVVCGDVFDRNDALAYYYATNFLNQSAMVLPAHGDVTFQCDASAATAAFNQLIDATAKCGKAIKKWSSWHYRRSDFKTLRGRSLEKF